MCRKKGEMRTWEKGGKGKEEKAEWGGACLGVAGGWGQRAGPEYRGSRLSPTRG